MKFDNRLITFNKPDLEKHLCLPKVFTPKLAEEIGLHIGDGSMNYYGLKSKGFYQLRGHITDDKPHYYSRIRKIYKDLFNLDINLWDCRGRCTSEIGLECRNNQRIAGTGIELSRNRVTYPNGSQCNSIETQGVQAT